MYNCYAVLAGDDNVSDAGRATTFMLNFKAPPLRTKSTKIEGPSGNMGFTGKKIRRFQTQKRSKTISVTFQRKSVKNQVPDAIN